MKKIVILMLFLCSAIRASDLSLAIEESNLEKVQSLLAKGSLSEKEMIKYLDSAEKMIALRREQTIGLQMGGIGPFIEGKMSHFAFITFSSISMSCGLLTSIFHFADRINPQWPTILAAASLATALPAIYYFKKTKKLYKDKIDSFATNHHNAIRIKEELYDRLN